MAEGIRPAPLLDQVIEKRRVEEERRSSEARAVEMLPDFKTQLGGLISEKVPPPETISREAGYFDIHDLDAMDHISSRRRERLSTKLTAAIPLEDGATTSVIISASNYPNIDDPDSVMGLSYRIDVEELDRILIIAGQTAVLQSKRWESEPFTSHTPIGPPQPTWPAWEHQAGVEDIEQYQELLESLNQEGVTFEGSTPPIIEIEPREANTLAHEFGLLDA